jgi:IS30 family transposase
MTKITRSSLTQEERCQISGALSIGLSIRATARRLQRSQSVISREIKRNKTTKGYQAGAAHLKAKRRACTARSVPRKLLGDTLNLVLIGLKEKWSPQQISGRLKESDVKISHETIYKMVWTDKARGGELYKHLRHNAKKYNKRAGTNAGRGLIPGRIDISERPQIVETKTRVGDWEADTIIGAQHQGALVTLVDRNSKLLLVSKVNNTTKEIVTAAILKMLKPLKGFVRTITFDNGKEFAGHSQIAKTLEADMYFAKPYHSWERGLNEHTNGLIRQYLPKGTNFLEVSHKTVRYIQKKINSRPRNVLSFRTPNEVFHSAVSVASTC